MSPGLKLRHGLLIVAVGGLLLFQNCAQPPDSSSTNSASSYEEGLPFAFKESLDTVAYMSCSDITADVEKRAYFTFRAGAYGPNSGLSMRKDFYDKTRFYTVTERARALGASDLNGNTLFNFSIRRNDNLTSILLENAQLQSPRSGREIESFLPVLSTPGIAGPFAARIPLSGELYGPRINYFQGSASRRLVEASLRFYQFENVAKQVRSDLEARNTILTAGYSTSGSEIETGLRQEAGRTTEFAYGTGFFPLFALPAASPLRPGPTSGERRVIASIEEVDLSPTGRPNQGNQWDCLSTWQFMIVRPEDLPGTAAGPVPKVNCRTQPDAFANATEEAALRAIRRVLRVEDWFVDVTNRCVVPKRTGDYCYGAAARPPANLPIRYTTAACIDRPTELCPHFVSVCIRR